MLVNLESYYIFSKIYLGANLTITFQYSMDINERKVLILSEVVGFVDKSDGDEPIYLHVAESGSSYAHDLSLRLRRPEIIDFQEAIIFNDKEKTQICFRACAKWINFRNWINSDM